ncbi:GDP-fucose transporter 1 [Nymphon striatum]|nr:GDP-fucose transporter 1 [Nymphon striatum]
MQVAQPCFQVAQMYDVPGLDFSGGNALDAPMFLTWFQCLVTFILIILLSLTALLFPGYISFPIVSMDLQKSKKILPLSVVFVGMISFNNLCLKHVGVSFYYIARSLTMVFNVSFTYIILGKKTSGRAVACCVIIILGYLLGVNQEEASGSFSLLGAAYGVLGSLCLSLYTIFTKKVLAVVDGNIWLLQFYNNINASVLFLPLIIFFGEIPLIRSYENLYSTMFWGLLFLSGVFGLLIGVITGLQIKVTSPLTHNISGTAKACAQTVLACVWYFEVKSYLWWTGNLLVLLGSGAYTRIKQLEMKKGHEESQKQIMNDEKLESEKSVTV